jgi:hypothetical protein
MGDNIKKKVMRTVDGIKMARVSDQWLTLTKTIVNILGSTTVQTILD